jgi:hypothetical protein
MSRLLAAQRKNLLCEMFLAFYKRRLPWTENGGGVFFI